MAKKPAFGGKKAVPFAKKGAKAAAASKKSAKKTSSKK